MQLTMILEQCWHSLALYGKDVNSFPFVIQLFENRLAGYPAKEILPAFEKYIDNATTFPAPADIVAIIQKRVKRDPAYYRELLRKRRDEFCSTREHEYIRAYELSVLEDWDR
jgi:hypothetical protein